MLTLSYGYKKPQLDDTGDFFFPALEADIQQLNDHTHDGSNSALLSSTPQTVSHLNWVAVTNFKDFYSQLVTMPGALVFDNVTLSTRDTAGVITYNRIEKASANTFLIYTNLVTQDLVVEYSS